MTHPPEVQEKAVHLRGLGFSLKKISKQLGVPTSTLYGWLRDTPLPSEEVKARGREANAGRRRSGYVRGKNPSRISRLTEGQKLTKLQKAKIAEAAVLLRLVAVGCNPFGSMFDGDTTDWLVELMTGKVIKVQVKWGVRSSHSEAPTFALRHGTGNKRYEQGEFDVFVGYDIHNDSAFVWTWKELENHKTGISATKQAEERWDKVVDGWKPS